MQDQMNQQMVTVANSLIAMSQQLKQMATMIRDLHTPNQGLENAYQQANQSVQQLIPPTVGQTGSPLPQSR